MIKDSNKFITNSQNSKIITEITNNLDDCDEFVISVAFITLSGVVCILESLRKLQLKGIKGRILTGCYLNFTEPKALEKLLDFKNIELKVVANENFHAKGFFFRKANNWQIMIGSANLTQSALTVNSEWNVLFQVDQSQNIYSQVIGEFNRLFNDAIACSEILEDYRANYQSVRNTTHLELFRQANDITPNIIQKQALENLQELRNNFQRKALIISATGTGKTYLSAFDVSAVKPKRCLFIVHRTNIAIKAQQTFAKLIKDKTMGLYTGSDKSSAEYLFATVQTLKNLQVLAKFAQDEFDYIIVDEVHHAEAGSYKKVLGYFKPKFLLGMTATPERSDNADIFKLFDYNIAYEIRLHQALEQDLLCPFHYFALEDLYLESANIKTKDFSKLVGCERAQHIVDKMGFYGFSGEKRSALMFVSNVDEAKELANQLNNLGIKTQALTSQDPEHIRSLAIQNLENHVLEVIVTVDIFNEGIDIPAVNQIILLRPTQSAIVYIQQLGRGLRKYKTKSFVVVLDFIANYENNFLIPVALSGDNSYDKDELKKFVVAPNNFITGKSTITFTSVAKELIYRNIQKTNFSQLKNIKRDYTQLKKELGKVPTLTDFETNNFISPEVILKAKDTYYDILLAFKENVPQLSTKEYSILKYVSKEVTPAKRLYEILIIENLLDTQQIKVSKLKAKLQTQINDFTNENFLNALKHLSFDIFTVNAGRSEYQPFITIKDNYIQMIDYDLITNNHYLLNSIEDLISYNKLIYTKKYADNNFYGLALYQKYSKKEIAHILNQDYSNGGVNLSGYRAFGDKALLYMTFDENKKFTQFDNKFVSKSAFTYFSKKNKSLNDTIENNLSQNYYTSFLFARINKNDSYIFLGMVKECLQVKELCSPFKMVEFLFELNQQLPEQEWLYFNTVYQNKI